jgi:TonB family protein
METDPQGTWFGSRLKAVLLPAYVRDRCTRADGKFGGADESLGTCGRPNSHEVSPTSLPWQVDAGGCVSEQTTSDTIKTSEPHVNRPSRKTVAKQNTSPGPEVRTEVLTGSQETVPIPLQVDVTYSSGQHTTLVARNSAIHVELPNSQQSFAMPLGAVSSAVGPVTGAAVAADKVRFTSQTVELVGRPVEPVYPPVAQRENVQGSVVLQARIGEDGTVQGLQVVSGPSILTTAALEAVKQWHFKPRVEAGKAIPAETRITVNFTISTQ